MDSDSDGPGELEVLKARSDAGGSHAWSPGATSPLRLLEPRRFPWASACANSDIAMVPSPQRLAETALPPWDWKRYQMLRILRPASKNWVCQVELYRDVVDERIISVKRFPSGWITESAGHQKETELPHLECGLSEALEVGDSLQELLLLENLTCAEATRAGDISSGAFCDLDSGDLLLVCRQVLEHNLFDHCQGLGPPGLERESEALGILRSLVKTAMALHEAGITHGRIRAESAWLQKRSDGSYEVFLTDFVTNGPGIGPDACYRAPEPLGSGSDACNQAPEPPGSRSEKAADLFACGVLGYALAVGCYPWLSTVSGKCRAFSFAENHGIDRFLQTAKCPASRKGCMSADYKAILGSLLDLDPEKRLSKASELRSELLCHGKKT